MQRPEKAVFTHARYQNPSVCKHKRYIDKEYLQSLEQYDFSTEQANESNDNTSYSMEQSQLSFETK
jgi:hypothetical protein